eukprot:TRINITY_DN15197_c0_g1_i1.p1 TRINITY_DN15197_c0_g1~~TRINITY_DN15197_c0_g1_i1.p1  ORF type:complete len:612 (+),score=81.32 TRINITY_DN15197_c0_g1_i1:77-1912(+)
MYRALYSTDANVNWQHNFQRLPRSKSPELETVFLTEVRPRNYATVSIPSKRAPSAPLIRPESQGSRIRSQPSASSKRPPTRPGSRQAEYRERVKEYQTLYSWSVRERERQRFPHGEIVKALERVVQHRAGTLPLPIDDERHMTNDELFPPLTFNVTLAQSLRPKNKTPEGRWRIAAIMIMFIVYIKAASKHNPLASRLAPSVTMFLRRRKRIVPSVDDVNMFRKRLQELELRAAEDKSSILMQMDVEDRLFDERDLLEHEVQFVELPPPLERLLPRKQRDHTRRQQQRFEMLAQPRHKEEPRSQHSHETTAGHRTGRSSEPPLTSVAQQNTARTATARYEPVTTTRTQMFSGDDGNPGRVTGRVTGRTQATQATQATAAASQYIDMFREMQREGEGRKTSLRPKSAQSNATAMAPRDSFVKFQRYWHKEFLKSHEMQRSDLLERLAKRDGFRQEVLKSGFLLNKALTAVDKRLTNDVAPSVLLPGPEGEVEADINLWVRARDELLADNKKLPTRREFYRRVAHYVVRHGGLCSKLEEQIIATLKIRLQSGAAVDRKLFDEIQMIIASRGTMMDKASAHLRGVLEFIRSEIAVYEHDVQPKVPHIRVRASTR